MSHSRTPKRLPPDALGMKALITTTSLAVTLGGWAVLAIEPAKPTAVADTPPTEAVVTERPAAEFTLNLPPLPTIGAPLPAPVAPPPAAPQPAPAAPPPAPSLRQVSAPPKPVARTRSSR